MWVRQLTGANKSYQILTIGDSPHINDNRFFLTTSTVDPNKNVRMSAAFQRAADRHGASLIGVLIARFMVTSPVSVIASVLKIKEIYLGIN